LFYVKLLPFLYFFSSSFLDFLTRNRFDGYSFTVTTTNSAHGRDGDGGVMDTGFAQPTLIIQVALGGMGLSGDRKTRGRGANDHQMVFHLA